MLWNPPVELSSVEEILAKRTQKRRKFFVFLREHRHHIIDHEFQQKLLATYLLTPGGTAPIPPGLLMAATLLQAYCNVSDQEAVELSFLDQRWQMALDTFGYKHPPFSQGTLGNFRQRIIEHGLDKLLIDRTVDVAEQYGGFSPRQLRIVLDSSPLFGAARVEDTFNLLGHALSKAVRLAAQELGCQMDQLIEDAGLLLVGRSSLKAALDLDWGQSDAKAHALSQILDELERWKDWLSEQSELCASKPPLKEAMETIEKILEQDTEPDPDPNGSGRKLTQDVAKDRRVSIEDPDMRHGRKSKSNRFKGYKQHFLGDLDSHVIRDVVVLRANEPEQNALDEFGLLQNLEGPNAAKQNAGEALPQEPNATHLVPKEGEKPQTLAQLSIDLGYAGHPKIEEWEEQGAKIVARPWRMPSTGFFTKEDFQLNFSELTVTCPGEVTIPMKLGKEVTFPTPECLGCPLRGQCIDIKKESKNQIRSRRLRIRADEEFQAARRARMKTSEGRAELRERVVIEHRIAHQVAHQGRKARYIGTRKNQYDGRRHAAVNNLHLADQYAQSAQPIEKAA